jgi:hypothetical protein
MQRAFLSFFLLMLVLAGGLNVARASSLSSRPVAKDTIVIKLPNQATITMVVRDAAQLRQMKNYQLDSLTSRLASYITQAENAAKNGTTDQVTVQFFPDKDQPGKNLPEQIRITTRKKKANTSRVDVVLNKTFGVTIETDQNGNKTYNKIPKTKEQREASRDSSRLRAIENKRTSSDLVVDLGLNALVDQQPVMTPTGPGETADLRTEGSRYVNIGLDWNTRLGGKRSPLSLTFGPHFAFNNFMLNGNTRWVNEDGITRLVRETGGREFQKSKLGTSSVNLPVMLRLQLRDKHYKNTFALAAGGFVGYRIKSWTKLKYTTDGNTVKDKEDGSYNMEDFLYGVQGTIGYGGLELFAKYHMNNLFKNNAGPETQVVSFGLRLFGN